MTYYRVPANMGDKPCYSKGSHGSIRVPNGWRLIANELLTEREARMMNAPIASLERVVIKKTDCYTMFGARFEKGRGA